MGEEERSKSTLDFQARQYVNGILISFSPIDQARCLLEGVNTVGLNLAIIIIKTFKKHKFRQLSHLYFILHIFPNGEVTSITGGKPKNTAFSSAVLQEVEDEKRRGIFPFSSAFSRTRQGIPWNFGLFLSHFKDKAFDPFFSRSRTKRGEEFCLIPRPFRGQDETLKNLCMKGLGRFSFAFFLALF